MRSVISAAGFAMLALILIACSTQEPEAVTVSETRLVEVPVTVVVEVPVTREVQVTVEVTRQIEVTPKATATPQEMQATLTPTPLAGMLTVGQEGQDGGQIYVLKEWAEAYSIPLRRGGEIAAPEGGKFIVAKISFFNDGAESVDIYCNFDFGRVLFDERGRKFDDTGRSDIVSLYDIAGNTGCNDRIQPGFGSEEETLTFLLPADAMPDYLMLWNPNEEPEFSDSFGEASAVLYQLER